MHDAYGILVIESSDWDAEQIRAYLRALSKPVRVLKTSDLEQEGIRIDVVILGFTDAVSLETSRSALEKARSLAPSAQLILCVPRESTDIDRKVLELKARAFLLKPIEEETFRSLMEQTLSSIHLRRERQEHERASKRSIKVEEIVGTSAQIKRVLELIDRVAESMSTSVLLQGESGVGKSLFAHTIHERSRAATGPFIEINCATLPANLIESELFGYEPGAFTDARAQKIGLIELADGGTLFLDEITEIDPVTQAKLLKFLDTKRFRRLGGDREITVETRVVAACNREMKNEVRLGRFREDLYYRLNVVEIRVPALRERREDIETITNHYLETYKKKFAKLELSISPAARAVIRAYPWPGNVRELVNVLERAVLLCNDAAVEPHHLPIEAPSSMQRALLRRRSDGRIEMELPTGTVTLDEVERALIEATLKRTRGNVSRAADLMGTSRGALRNKLTRYKIDARSFARPAFALQD
ncbi:MAG: sigma-54 dependent transcriptional regulator [Candidatus Latescibacteria bacterium]|nr:sigma-54 dependent transcriptional regulator [Candidatus Latescibacterota bacterium]